MYRSTCVHDPGLRRVTSSFDRSSQCLLCCVQFLCDPNQTSVRRGAVARSLVDTLRTCDIVGQLGTSDPLPLADQLRTAFMVFMSEAVDRDSQIVAAEGVTLLVGQRSGLQKRQVLSLVESAVEDILDYVASCERATNSEAFLGLLNILVELHPGITGRVISERPDDLSSLVVRALADPSRALSGEVLALLGKLCQAEQVERGDEVPYRLHDDVFESVSTCLPDLLQSDDVVLQCSALKLVSQLSTSPRRVHLLFPPYASGMAAALKAVLLQHGDATLKISAVQSLCQLATLSSATVQECISVNIPDILFECLLCTDNLLIESVLCCLELLSKEESFFRNFAVPYAFQPLMTCTAQLVQSNCLDAAVDAFEFLCHLLQKQSGFRASESLLRCFLQHLDCSIAKNYQNLTISSVRVMQQLIKSDILPTPIPMTLVQNHVFNALQATPEIGSWSVPSEGSQGSPMAAKSCLAAVGLLSSFVDTYVFWTLNPTAREESYADSDTARTNGDLSDVIKHVFLSFLKLFVSDCKGSESPVVRDAFLAGFSAACQAFGKENAEEVCDYLVALLREQFLNFLWETRGMAQELLASSGSALKWTLWIMTDAEFRNDHLLFVLERGVEGLGDTFESSLQLLELSSVSYSDAQLTLLHVCCAEWMFGDDCNREVSPSFVSAICAYTEANTPAPPDDDTLLLRSLTFLIAVTTMSNFEPESEDQVKRANTWLLDCLSRVSNWDSIIVPEDTVLSWCLCSERHRELLGSFALKKWMEMPQPPQNLLSTIVDSFGALQSVGELLSSEEHGVARETTLFLKRLIESNPNDEKCPLLKEELCFFTLNAFTYHWLRRTEETSQVLCGLLDMLTYCKKPFAGLVSGELEVFQQVLQLSTQDFKPPQWSTVIEYLLTVFCGRSSEVDSAASFLLCSEQVIEGLETQLSIRGLTRSMTFALLQKLVAIQLRTNINSSRKFVLNWQTTTAELQSAHTATALPVIHLLTAIFKAELWDGTCVRFSATPALSDYSTLLYILSNHVVRKNTLLEEAAVECLETLFEFFTASDENELANEFPAYPWLGLAVECRLSDSQVADEVTLRVMLLVFQGPHVNPAVEGAIPTVVDAVCQRDTSSPALAARVAARLLGTAYNAKLSDDHRGILRKFISDTAVENQVAFS
ncbi:uncharacterized protein LOC135391713 [Ornithodoros turicata]|uniref:uncharacterized protein LOC135391713 n=1 Tax=Ornithodoros turicata TaxID=34597 RepID=UPI00313A3742